MMKNIYIIILSLLFLSCKEDKLKGKLIINFPEEIKIKSVLLKSITPYYPKSIDVKDSLLIVLNTKGNFLFQVYNTSSEKLLVEFGTEGRGPQEFEYPVFTNQISKIGTNTYHNIFDWRKKNMVYINFKDYILDRNTISTVKPLFNSDEFKKITSKIVYYSDTLSIIAPNDEGGQSGRFKIIKNNRAGDIAYFPKFNYEIPSGNLYPFYATMSSSVNVEKRKFVATTLYIGEYDFFDFSGNYLGASIFNEDNDLREIATQKPWNLKNLNNESTLHTTQIKNYDNLIYSLYTPYSISGEPMSNSKIHVLDWDGTPIKEYILDRVITDFAYDYDNNCFYGIDPMEEEYQIIKFKLE